MNDIRKIENLHVALWLLKDSAWCSLWRPLGIAMVPPTFVIAVMIAWQSRKSPDDLVHNLAVCFWVCANMIWMTGEFFYNDGTRPLAKVFFFTGLALLAGYYGREFRRRFFTR